MDLLTTAIKIACHAHDGQTDKGGEPYIFHPLRVMMACNLEDERIVAVLHDVIEDSDIQLPDLQSEYNIPDNIIRALDAITKREGENYKSYLKRVAKNRIATSVKMSDILDNISDKRIHNIDASLAKRYFTALDYLSKVYENEYSNEN